MLSKLNNVLCEQLAKNLAEQDFYKNVCTEILMKNEVVMRLLHPSMNVLRMTLIRNMNR